MATARRRALKVDSNQGEIVKALRAAGAFVHCGGPMDALVGYKGSWWVVEIKAGHESQRARTLTKREIDFIMGVGGRAPVHVVRDVGEALALIGVRV